MTTTATTSRVSAGTILTAARTHLPDAGPRATLALLQGPLVSRTIGLGEILPEEHDEQDLEILYHLDGLLARAHDAHPAVDEAVLVLHGDTATAKTAQGVLEHQGPSPLPIRRVILDLSTPQTITE